MTLQPYTVWIHWNCQTISPVASEWGYWYGRWTFHWTICMLLFYAGVLCHRPQKCKCSTTLLTSGTVAIGLNCISLASFPGRLPQRSLDRIRVLWRARRSGRRPGITSTSSNCKVDSMMTYVDSVLVIMAMCLPSNSHDSKRHKTTLLLFQFISYNTEDSTLDSRWAVMRW